MVVVIPVVAVVFIKVGLLNDRGVLDTYIYIYIST